MQQFSKISDHEKELAKKVMTRTGMPYPDIIRGTETLYSSYTQDRESVFTHCILMWETKDGVYLSVGSAKRVTYVPLEDEPNVPRGMDIAFTRAYKAALFDELIQGN